MSPCCAPKSGGGINLPNPRFQWVALSRVQRRPLNANFETFSSYLQDDCNLCALPTCKRRRKTRHMGSAVLSLSVLGPSALPWRLADHFRYSPIGLAGTSQKMAQYFSARGNPAARSARG